MAKDEKQCFIIMPITTPEPLLNVYRDGAEHFDHVLNCLLIPGVEKAGFKARPPSAKGAELIQANIIKNLETADMVLCDMSSLNPNVFFEFGIRTALNKPVCVVKDELTKKVPFDTSILNYHTYVSSLEPWELDGEISKLASHIEESDTRGKGENDMWRYFGIKSEAKAYEGATGPDAKWDHIMTQMDSLLRKVDRIESAEQTPASLPKELLSADRIYEIVSKLLPHRCKVTRFEQNASDLAIVFTYKGLLDDERADLISRYVQGRYGREVRFVPLGTEHGGSGNDD